MWNRRWLSVLALSIGLSDFAAHAQEVRWRNAVSGSFEGASNWVGGLVPNANQTAVFGLNGSTNAFTVSFAQGETNTGLTVLSQHPSFSLGAFTYTITGDVTIGGANGPALTLLDGTLRSDSPGRSAVIGRTAGTTGSATISGPTSIWQGLDTIADSGQGDLIVSNGGQVSCASRVGWIGRSAGSTGSVLLIGAGSQFDQSAALGSYIGDAGAGTLTIQQGAHAYSQAAWIGNWGTATGQATIDGTASRWTLTDILRVASAGHGTLNITNGASVTCLALAVGDQPSGVGAIAVDGAGSYLTSSSSSGNSAIGNQGSGTLTVSNGASATFSGGYPVFVAGWNNSTGRVTVAGTGSNFHCTGDLHVGSGGDGTFTITNGATASMRWVSIGADATTGPARFSVESGSSVTPTTSLSVSKDGVATVTGAGSAITSPNTDFIVGIGPGTGTFNVTDGGYVQAGLSVGAAGGAGIVSIDGPGSIWTTLRAAIIGNDTSVGANVRITNGGALECDFAYLSLASPNVATVTIDGADSTWFVSRDLNVGQLDRKGRISLRNGGRLFGSPVRLQSTGVLEGTGAVEGTIENGGLISPGDNAHGTIAVTGSVSQASTGELAMQISGPTPGLQHDVLSVTNTASVAGTLALSLTNGFVPTVGQQFDVVTAGLAVDGQFAAVTGSDLGNGHAFVVQYLPYSVRLVADAVTGVDISQPSLAVYDGYSEVLTAMATFAAWPAQNVTTGVAWTSDDPAIASVSADGKVTAHAAGVTTVRATYSGFSDGVPVTVTALPVPDGVLPGLNADFYRFWWPQFHLLTPVVTEIRSTPSIPWGPWDSYGSIGAVGGESSFVGGVMTGTLHAPVGGTYTFWHEDANGESRVYVDGQLVVIQRDMTWYLGEFTGQIDLPAGDVSLRIEYSKRGDYGGYGHQLSWLHPGIANRELVPASAIAAPGLTMSYYLPPTPPLPDTIEQFDAANFDVYLSDGVDNLDFPLNVYPNFTDVLGGDVAAVYAGWLIVDQPGSYTLYVPTYGLRARVTINGALVGVGGPWPAGDAISVLLNEGLNAALTNRRFFAPWRGGVGSWKSLSTAGLGRAGAVSA